MRIEVTQPGREEFYREVVSLSYQYKKLQKRPNRRIRDMFKSFRNNLIAAIILLAVLLIEFILWGLDTELLILALVLIALVIVNVVYLKNMKATVANMLRDHASVFIVDEDGIEVHGMNSLTVRMGWDKVAFVRCFHESVCFIPNGIPGFILSIQKEYKDQIYGYLRENGKGNLIVE